MNLILDTETSGVTNTKLPTDHPDQGHIMQLAMILVDEAGVERGCFYSLIKPEVDYNVHPKAFEAHHIDRERCEEEGVPLKLALELFNSFASFELLVAFNIKFDLGIIDNDSALVDMPNYSWNTAKQFCVMHAMTDICKLPAKWKGTAFKWPKLHEAYSHCFGKEMEGAHDALADVRATAAVYQWYKQNMSAQPYLV